jgi:acetylornithine deacetylase/succinyl-diaminopimelate desuccinylase-like protein
VAEFWSDVRLTPGMDQSTFEVEMMAALADTAAGIPGIRYEVEFSPNLRWLEATEVPADHQLTHACQGACTRVLGRDVPLAAFPGASDAYPFQHIGGIPTIAALGPGLLTPAHGPNEWISRSSLLQAPEIYTELAISYCASHSEREDGRFS